MDKHCQIQENNLSQIMQIKLKEAIKIHKAKSIKEITQEMYDNFTFHMEE